MQVTFSTYHQPTFRQSFLKGLFKRGKLPTVKKGLYGGELTPENVTDEHVVAKSKGGTKKTNNIALATKENNESRGNDALREHLTQQQIDEYVKQYENVEVPEENFDGNSYIRGLLANIRKAWNME